MNKQHSTRRFAFTLIELLVVIAVIALLIGILLPALGKARSQGQSAKCQGHLRQYASAHQIYITDHGLMPGLGAGNENSLSSQAWVVETGVFDSEELGITIDPTAAKIMNGFPEKYLKDPRVSSCPADPQTRPGAEAGERVGNLLVPDEDPKAVGTCMTRVWFNEQQDTGDPPPDYVTLHATAYATIGGITESHPMRYLRADRLIHPSQTVDVVEEDENSTLSNSVFVPEDWTSGGYPPLPGQENLISNNHPAKSGNLAYHDGHVSNIPNIETKYWAEEDFETRLEIIWWPYYKDNDDQP